MLRDQIANGIPQRTASSSSLIWPAMSMTVTSPTRRRHSTAATGVFLSEVSLPTFARLPATILPLRE